MPPLLDPLEQGWMRDTVKKILTPVMLPKSSVPLAPDYISTMINCSCENCGSTRSSCVSYALSCTVLCLCDDVMLLCKCQIQTMIRKINNYGITMLCQNIYNSCTIAISGN